MNQTPPQEDFYFEKFIISIGSILLFKLTNEDSESVQKLYKLSFGKNEEKLYFLFSHDHDDELYLDDFTIFHDYEGNDIIQTILNPYLKVNNFEGFDLDEEIGEYTCYSGSAPSTKSFAKELIEHLSRFEL